MEDIKLRLRNMTKERRTEKAKQLREWAIQTANEFIGGCWEAARDGRGSHRWSLPKTEATALHSRLAELGVDAVLDGGCVIFNWIEE